MNGHEVEQAERATGLFQHPLVEKAQGTEPIQRRAGKNALLIGTQPPKGRSFKAFDAAFIALDETLDLMTDLTYQ